jgi:uncharacterized protein with GYD domain
VDNTVLARHHPNNNIMTRYITLLNFTEKGATHLKDSTKRAHHFDEVAEKAGVKIDGQYWTIGAYDGVLIIHSESEQKALHLLAELAAAGNVRTETMRAFTEQEFAGILN